jgi:hypothetical protein
MRGPPQPPIRTEIRCPLEKSAGRGHRRRTARAAAAHAATPRNQAGGGCGRTPKDVCVAAVCVLAAGTDKTDGLGGGQPCRFAPPLPTKPLRAPRRHPPFPPAIHLAALAIAAIPIHCHPVRHLANASISRHHLLPRDCTPLPLALLQRRCRRARSRRRLVLRVPFRRHEVHGAGAGSAVHVSASHAAHAA